MKTIIYLLALLSSVTLIAQNNALILQDAAHINIDGGAILIVAQTNPNGIVTQGTNTGVINSEGETNRVAWIINNGTGNYVIPFGINSSDRFPMTYNVTTAGSATGALTASTFPTNNANLPRPSVYFPSVTNTSAQDIPGFGTVERSLFCSDRFWVLRDLGNVWGTKPTSSLTFTYKDVENAGTNTINAANLGAQYWETDQWRPGWYSGPPPLGAANITNKTVSGVNAGSLGNLYTWILVDKTNPLPIELLYFAVTCHEMGTNIEWASASETNNDYYTIQKSFNGENWETLTYITGAGNSNQPLYYSYIDYNGKNQNAVYRLIQTDYDGSQNQLGVKDANCDPHTNGTISGVDMNLYADDENNIYVSYFSSFAEINVLQMYDMTGKIIGSWELSSIQGINHFQIPVQPVSHAIYLISLQQNNSSSTKKILLK